MDARAAEMLEHPAVGAACHRVVELDPQTLTLQVALSQIPAPSYHEGPRGDRVALILEDAGLSHLTRDEVGNVVAWLGRGPAPLVVSAHLDTVFPLDTDVTVRHENGRWVGPGISDDARGLAALLTLARVLCAADLPTARPVAFAATVGEEGHGDLRGVRHLFREGGPFRHASGFISLDGAGMRRIVSRALGSRRLRATVTGPGGHSWVDWGTPNPIHALGAAVEAIARMPLSTSPTATATVARWGGGRSVNAIPDEAWVEMDLRSQSAEVLRDTEARVRQALGHAVERANAHPGHKKSPSLELSVQVIGDRPAGATPDDSDLVAAACGATRAMGREPELITSSTDANVAMALGIPAVTLGAGGKAGRAHSTDEWYANEGGPDGVIRALLTILLAAGLRDGGT